MRTIFEMMDTSAASLVSEVKDRIRAARLVSLFLDFDGTLVPIAPDPTTPRLDESTSAILNQLGACPGMATTIISGRAVEDLFTRARLDGWIYAGNHGLEIFGRKLCFVEPVADQCRSKLAIICEDLAAQLKDVPGAIVENKGLTASIHLRQADAKGRELIQQAVYETCAHKPNLFRVNRGRKILEIVPRTNWHKGTAVQWINRHIGEPDLTIYAGDDTTDEDAFAVLPDGITVQVGNSLITSAQHRLPDPGAVLDFLGWLAAARSIRIQKA